MGVLCAATSTPVNITDPKPEGALQQFDVPLEALVDGYNVIELHAPSALTVQWGGDGYPALKSSQSSVLLRR